MDDYVNTSIARDDDDEWMDASMKDWMDDYVNYCMLIAC
jgi:hypothetical protein